MSPIVGKFETKHRMYMRVKKSLVLLLTFSIMVAVFTGCSKSDSPLTGEWAYLHDKETAAFTVTSKGKAVLDGTEYDCKYDDSFITLSASDSNTKKLRYILTDEGLILYKSTDYTYSGDGTPADVVGHWEDTKDSWSYDFTSDGAFVEDGFFSGKYTVNTSEGTIVLDYNEDFDDTTIYYTLSGNTITIEYPWKMVKLH